MSPGPQKDFCIGPLEFRLDGDSGFVRNIRFHGKEVLRGIYPAVRDRDWATLRPNVERVSVDSTVDQLKVGIEARTVGTEMDLAWTAEIVAAATGQIKYTWHGLPRRACMTNRTGLCVLHPAVVAGAPCVVEHTDGRREAGWFPTQISPHQPFHDIRALAHVVGDCSEVAVRLEGDVFEMEDQRNWTDASFKIYSRPLAWARPYRLEAGAEIQQSITMEVRGTWKPNEIAPVASQSGRISLPLPGIGFTLPGPIPSSLRERVRALRPAHVRVEATPDTLAATLDWARADATFLDCALVVAIRSTRDSAPDRSLFPSRCTVHLFDAEGNSASRETLAAWQRAGHNSLATGTLHNFAELNRNRPPADGSHTHTVFGINAQIHAEDDVSILETLTQHEAVARCAHRVGAGRPVIVGPISLGRRNDSVDPRVRTQFGARWLLESLKLLAKSACVESVTCFHAHGPAGFMDETRSTPVERLLKALAGRDTLPADFAIPA